MWLILTFNIIYNSIILFKIIYYKFTFISVTSCFLEVSLNSLLFDSYYYYSSGTDFPFLSCHILFE